MSEDILITVMPKPKKVDQPLAPTTKSPLKPFVFGVLATVLVLGTLYLYNFYINKQAQNYKKSYQTYASSPEIKEVVGRLQAMTTDRNGLMQRIFTCQLNSAEVLHKAATEAGLTPDAYDTQTVSVLSSLQNAVNKASAKAPELTALPLANKVSAYRQASQASKDLKSWLNTASSLRSNENALYCSRLYANLYILHVIDSYTTEELSVDDVQRFYATIADASNTVKAQPLPTAFASTAEDANVLLQSYGSDMGVVVYSKVNNSALDEASLRLRYAKDKDALEAVLLKASQAGKDTTPTPASVLAQLSRL